MLIYICKYMCVCVCKSANIFWRLCNTGARLLCYCCCHSSRGHRDVHSFCLQRISQSLFHILLTIINFRLARLLNKLPQVHLLLFKQILYSFHDYLTRFSCFVTGKRTSLPSQFVVARRPAAAVYYTELPYRPNNWKFQFEHGSMTSGLILIY